MDWSKNLISSSAGIRDLLARAGIKVVQDRCLMVEYRRLQMAQSSAI